jgi:large conductance mechanosensitive channel
MPPIGYAMKGIDFSNLKVVLVPAAGKTPEVAISYGLLINAIINFLIVALAIFIVIQQMNKLKKKPQELPPSTKECEFCKETISVRATRCPHCTATLSAGKPLDQQPA